MSKEEAPVTINDSNDCKLATENINPVSPIPPTVAVTTGGRKKSLIIIFAIIAAVLIIAAIVALSVVLTRGNSTTIQETTMMTSKKTTTEVSSTGAATTEVSIIGAATTPLNDFTNIIFTAQSTYSSGPDALPVSLAVADVNNDKKPDIIVVNQDKHDFAVLLNKGSGTFSHRKAYSIKNGTHPQDVSVGDINGDDIPDLFIAMNGGNGFIVVLNFGSGTFILQKDYRTGNNSYPTSLTVADVNNDKKLDVIIANQNENYIGVSLNPGGGIFTSQKKYTSNGIITSPTSPSVVDINGDNKSDIVFANYDAETVCILFNSGNGTFDSLTTYSTGSDSKPKFVSVVGVNQDDKVDIVVANSKSNNVGVLLNTGDGTFLAQKIYSTGNNSSPHCVSVVDLNGDNKPEIIVANTNEHNVGILVNIGNGAFLLGKTYSTGKDSYPRFVSVIDVNNDNKSDIIIANSETSNVGVMLAA